MVKLLFYHLHHALADRDYVKSIDWDYFWAVEVKDWWYVNVKSRWNNLWIVRLIRFILHQPSSDNDNDLPF